jgi:Icc-related predicted phosphoesterase
MVIISLSDIHGNTRCLESIGPELKAADIVLLTGDITHFGKEGDAARIIAGVQRYNRHILAVPGNCDYPEVDDYLSRIGINLHCRTVEFESLVFLGIGGSLPCPGITPNEYTEEEFGSFLEKTGSKLKEGQAAVLVSHQPPRASVVDRVANSINPGSVSVRAFIEKYRPLLCFCGHIHEGKGIETIGVTKVANPGPCPRGHYVFARVAQEVEEIEIRRF